MIEKSCILCNYKNFETISKNVRDSKKHQVIQCKKCKHIQLNPIPTEKEEKKFYDENLQDKNINFFGGIKENREKSKEDTQRRVNFVKKMVPKKGKILEIGSGHGFFLESMERLGYNITGIEISKEKRRLAKRITKSKILNINLINETPDIKNLDAIVMFHVLEYITDPIHFLKNTSKLLKNTGKLLIKIPNVNDLSLKHHESYKIWFWQRAHANYFSPKVLKLVLKKAGFKKIKISGIQRYSIENMFNWRLIGSPQLKKPTFELPLEYQFIDNYYKKHLENNFNCDTLLVIAQK